MPKPVPPGQNALLASLPQEEMRVLKPELERIDLELRHVLQAVDEPASHVWFMRNGVASVVSTMEDGAIVELATVGREGVIGVPEILGASQRVYTVFMQVAGQADRLPVDRFKQMQRTLPSLQPLLLRYTMAFMAQIAQSAACNRLHPIEARCARWLLMSHDRVEGDRFLLTQEFLGQMLGVTRPSVSVAAGMLQKAGYIRYARGTIDILDRPGLEAASCECYGVIRQEFQRLFDVPKTRP